MRQCPTCRARFKGKPTTCPLDGSTLVELEDPMMGRTVSRGYMLVAKAEKQAASLWIKYFARHDASKRIFDVDFLAPELAQSEERVVQFRALRRAHGIPHENILEIIDCGETLDGLWYVVTEHLEGPLLSDELARARLSVARTLDIGRQLARALARAHAGGVIHGDVRPEEVRLIERDDRMDVVKLLGFERPRRPNRTRNVRDPVHGGPTTVLGFSPRYGAPEQWVGGDASHATDLHALGCLMYEMLVGEPPHGANAGLVDMYLKMRRRQPTARVSERRSEVPAAISELVATLMDPDPAKRPATASDAADGLEAALGRWVRDPTHVDRRRRCPTCFAAFKRSAFCPLDGARLFGPEGPPIASSREPIEPDRIGRCPTCGARFKRATSCPLDGSLLTQDSDPFVGRTIAGRFAIEARLESTDPAVSLYRARHAFANRLVAVRVLLPHLETSPEHRRALLDAARTCARVAHPHVVDVSDFGTTADGLAFLVSAHVAGEPLSKEIALGRLSAIRAVDIALQIAEALGAAHDRDIVHGDLRPSHVLLTLQEGRADFVKLLGFERIRLTDDPGSAANDVLSLGRMIYSMLIGEPPEVVTSGAPSVPVTRLSERRLGVPEELEELVARSMDSDPARRPTARQLADRLAAIQVQLRQREQDMQ